MGKKRKGLTFYKRKKGKKRIKSLDTSEAEEKGKKDRAPKHLSHCSQPRNSQVVRKSKGGADHGGQDGETKKKGKSAKT